MEAARENSAVAEITAGTMAAAFAIQCIEAKVRGIRVSIYGDNENSRGAAEGRHFAGKIKDRAIFLRGMARWCQEMHSSTSWHYTKAHI